MLNGKKTSFFIFLINFIAIFSLQAVPLTNLPDLRQLAMGSTAVAIKEFHGSFPRNPALLFQRESNLFRTGIRYQETIKTSVVANDPIPAIQNPKSTFELMFSNRYLGLSIALANNLADREIENNQLNFIAYNDSKVELNVAYGWRSFSFGFYAQGASQAYKDVILRKESPVTDYLEQAYLSRYDRQSEDGQFFSSGIGFLLTYQWASIGFMSDSLFTLDYDTNELSFDIVDSFKASSVGIAISTNKYNKDNELNLIVFNGGFDLTNIGNSESRSLSIGLEGKIQFMNNLYVAVRGGYKENRPSEKPLFAFDGDGTLTAGLGSRFGSFAIDLATEIPLNKDYFKLAAGLTWGF
jgi:hypothetical protein